MQISYSNPASNLEKYRAQKSNWQKVRNIIDANLAAADLKNREAEKELGLKNDWFSSAVFKFRALKQHIENFFKEDPSADELEEGFTKKLNAKALSLSAALAEFIADIAPLEFLHAASSACKTLTGIVNDWIPKSFSDKSETYTGGKSLKILTESSVD